MEGRQAGQREGELKIVQRLLKVRLEAVPVRLIRQVNALDLVGLEALADALLGFNNVGDLRVWLKKHQN